MGYSKTMTFSDEGLESYRIPDQLSNRPPSINTDDWMTGFGAMTGLIKKALDRLAPNGASGEFNSRFIGGFRQCN